MAASLRTAGYLGKLPGEAAAISKAFSALPSWAAARRTAGIYDACPFSERSSF